MKHFIDCVEIEDAEALGLLYGGDQLARPRHPGEVDQSPGEARNRNAPHNRAVGLG